MRSIIRSSIQARLVVISVVALLLAISISQLRDMRLGVFPEYSPVYVEVQTETLGLSAEETEQLITVAIEQDLLNGIAYLDEIWSETMPGFSRIVCVFEPGTDPMVARQVVGERLTMTYTLPRVCTPPVMLQPYSSTSRVMKVGLSPSSEELSLIDLSVLARWTIQPYLMGVKGVANVSIWGQRKRQLQVQTDPAVLNANNIVLQDVINTTGEALWVSPLSYLESSTPGTGGFFDTPNQRLGVRHILPISKPEDLAKIPIEGRKDLQLGDVATVVENHQPMIGDAVVAGGEPGLMLVIEKFPWASTGEVTQRVQEALNTLSPGLDGVAFDSEIYQPANFIKASFGNLSTALAVGLGLAVLLLVFFFSGWRSALISTIAIAVSLLAGVYVLHLQEIIFDMMIMAGFIAALGIIIDDAISTVDNVQRRLQKNREAGSDKKTGLVILEAVQETRNPILFAAFILLLAAIPLFFLQGTKGIFLNSLVSSYVLALAASTLTAMIVTPALCIALFSGSSSTEGQSSLLASIGASLSAGIARFIQKPVVAYATMGVLLLAGLVSLTMMNTDPQIPIPKERDLVIQWKGEQGASQPEMVKSASEAIKKLKALPGVNNAAAHVGRAVMSDKVENVHGGEIWISMDQKADYDATLAAVQQVIDGFPQVNSEIQSYREQKLNQKIRGNELMYSVRVYGENQQVLTEKAEEVQKAISGVSGVSETQVIHPPLEPQLEVRVTLEKLREYGLKPGEVRRAAATLLAGVNVGSLFEGQKVFEVVVWGIPGVRSSIEDVENLLIDTPDGGQVRIGEIAEVVESDMPAVIQREKVSRYLDVSFNYAGSLSALNTNINRSLAGVDFPMEYHAELSGEFNAVHEARGQLFGVFLACLIGILLLLQAAFRSWRLATVIFPTLFFSISGGALVVLLSGGNLSMGALAGLLAVLGISVYNAMLLIMRFINLELLEDKAFGPDLVLQGVKERMGSILMTTIIAAIVFLPMLFFGNAPGLEMARPMAGVVLGGLVTSTVTNLFIVPALYLAFGKVPESVKEEERAMLELGEVAPSLN